MRLATGHTTGGPEIACCTAHGYAEQGRFLENIIEQLHGSFRPVVLDFSKAD